MHPRPNSHTRFGIAISAALCAILTLLFARCSDEASTPTSTLNERQADTADTNSGEPKDTTDPDEGEPKDTTDPNEGEPKDTVDPPESTYDLYVSSRGTHSVKRYDGVTGVYLGDFVAAGSGGLNLTQEVAFGPDSNLYVSARLTNFILKYDRNSGAFLGRFTTGYDLDEPTKMTFGPDGMLYVSQWGQTKSTVACFDAHSGVFVDEATAMDLNQPMAHAWDNDGILYVASFGSRDVRRFDAAGNLIDVFIQGGILQSAVNLWFGDEGELFVADWTAGAILMYEAASGDFVSRFITGLGNVEGVTLGPDGALYACDWQFNVINRYDAQTGEFLGEFAAGGGLVQPNSLVFGPKPKE